MNQPESTNCYGQFKLPFRAGVTAGTDRYPLIVDADGMPIVRVYATAATTQHLTSLLNRDAEQAQQPSGEEALADRCFDSQAEQIVITGPTQGGKASRSGYKRCEKHGQEYRQYCSACAVEVAQQPFDDLEPVLGLVEGLVEALDCFTSVYWDRYWTENSATEVAAVLRSLLAEVERLREENARLYELLAEISKGEGPYSQDRLTQPRIPLPP